MEKLIIGRVLDSINEYIIIASKFFNLILIILHLHFKYNLI